LALRDMPASKAAGGESFSGVTCLVAWAGQGVAVAAEGRTQPTGHAGELPDAAGVIGLRGFDLGQRLVRGDHLPGCHMWVTSKPPCGNRVEAGIGQVDQLGSGAGKWFRWMTPGPVRA
jgi:hypothetical protein